ncbi:phosphoglycerate dehydrogenase [Brevibacillus composti]|uniref:D-3-phosphoglycerate dehydrogenase n=1 Tax=Brevibacillus composti TaxID=2796470 RepID=A0A7T5JMA3_9BACL|nr:phosphoglycerate dehydrogenase [Brevibacillus composti]QQE72811.1 phosphoglycerate dehydrogenase [Brevibacillus composti]QUO39889.1 phosphoglycerate dehydrogenase [Brevibacillus composti]
MYKVLITDQVSEYGIKQLLEAPDVEVVKNTNLSPSDLLAVIGDYDALMVRSQTQVTAEVLAAGKRLKAVGRAGVGVDNIDVNAATEAGIVVINAPDGNTISTAEHSFAMLMSVARNIPQAYRKLADGTWDRKSFQGVELNNKVLGVIGMGRIGTEVAKRAKVFGMTVLAYDPFLTEERAQKLGVTNATVDEICRQADFITVHTPLTKETRYLISSREFAKMKTGVRVINCARGGIIDEKALYEAILTGKVAGAALDVFEVEPPVDNPLIGLPQVVVTPHLGASTVEAQENVAVDVSGEILKVLRGEPFRNAVNLPSIPPHVMERIEPYFTLGERLGHFLAQVTVGSVQEISITYSGELTDVETAPLTRTVVKGVLSFHLGEEVNFVNAPLLAKSRDITVTEKKSAQNRGFTNLLTVTLKTTQQTRTVAGTRLNGYGARIVKIDEFAIDVAPEGYLLYIHHNDRPGVIGRVGSILGENGVNIATMQVGRRDVGGEAIMMLSVDKPITAELLDTMGELPEVKSVTQIEL